MPVAFNCNLQCVKRSEAGSAEENDEEQVTSTVRPDEIPPIPENRFLMRRSPQQQEEAGRDRRRKEDRPRDR